MDYLNYSNVNQLQPPPPLRGSLIRLFSTPVLICPCPINYNKELELIRNIDCRKGNKDGHTNISYNRQSEDTFILDMPELSNIRAFIEEKLRDFVTNIYASDDKIVITQSWLNKNKKGEQHHEHVHPNSIISGVWYPQLYDESPPICFTMGRKKEYALTYKQFNEFNSETYISALKMGDLVLFPSNLSHSVPPNQSDKERISLSFNTWMASSFGDIDRLTYVPMDRCV